MKIIKRKKKPTEEEFYDSKTVNKQTIYKTKYAEEFNCEKFTHASLNEECTHATLCIPTYCK